MYNGGSGYKETYCYNLGYNIKKNYRIFIYILLFFAILFLMTNNRVVNKTVFAEENNDNYDIEKELEDTTNEILNNIDFSSIENFLETSDLNYSIFEGKTVKEYIVSIVKGEIDLSFESVFEIILSSIKNYLKKILVPLLSIFLIILLASLFNNLRGKKISGVSEIVYLFCFSSVVIILSVLSKDLVVEARDAVSDMQTQMNIIFPILLALMTSVGGVATVGTYSPIVAFLSVIVSKVFVYILFPMFTLSFALSIVGSISKNSSLEKFNIFIKSSFKWILGIVCTVFMAFLSVKSIVSAGKDGLTIKATKYAIKNYIPMLGGYISDGFEVVKAGGLIVKNAVGVVGLILLLSTCLLPIISIALTQLGLNLLAGVVEPFGDKKSSSFLSSVSGSLKLLIAIIIGVALMYFFTIYLMICSLSGIL